MPCEAANPSQARQSASRMDIDSIFSRPISPQQQLASSTVKDDGLPDIPGESGCRKAVGSGYSPIILTFINEKCIHALKWLHKSRKNKNNSKATKNINKNDMS